MSAAEQVMCYVGVRSCGCAVAAAVDGPAEMQRGNAREVAKWIRAGLTVERWTVERVRVELMRCTHQPTKAKTK